jgi:hypothetical protein
MPTTPRSFLASHRDDASRLVERAKKFSVHVPVVGRVSVPAADQLAFYGMLGILAAVNVIDWPVALAIGVGGAVVARHVNHRPAAPTEDTASSASEVGPVGREPTSAHDAEAPVPKTAPRPAARKQVKPATA